MHESFVIEEWDPDHPRWSELLQFIEVEHQSHWVAAHAAWHLSTHMLVALQGLHLVGFLRFITQEIGVDEDHMPVTLDEVVLTEAKVLAFGVTQRWRRHGIGRALQEATLRRAKQLGCYQVRSHTSGSQEANHRLKLAMGFGVHPIVRGDDTSGVYFVMPLKTGDTEEPR